MRKPIAEVMRRLEEISAHEGVPFGRTQLIFDAEEAYSEQVLSLKGYLALSNAFKCLFLETVEAINVDARPQVTGPISEFYAIFVPRITNDFRAICGAERIAIRGYPYQGYTLLRNVFDNLVLSSAALQSLVDFYSIEGVVPGIASDPASVRKLQKKTEIDTRRVMTGPDSGLSLEAIEEIQKWDRLFDSETHGSRLSTTHAMDWMRGVGPLPVLPKFDETAFALFMNRFCEVAWMLHRVLPMTQPAGIALSNAWQVKWQVVDETFEQMVSALTEQMGKRIGHVIVELVTSKFPFSARSTFPW